jgi:lipopolysaccharide heptosyltransferase II
MTNMRWQTARNILCVRLDTLGDVLMTSPAIRALRDSLAGCRTVLLTSPAGAEAARMIPEVDQVRVYESPWMKATTTRLTASAEFNEINWLRSQGFDAAVIFTVYSQSPLPAAMLCYLAGIPLRLAHCRENPYQLLTDWAPELEPHQLLRHEVRRQLDLVETIGCRTNDLRLSLAVSKEARAHAHKLLRRRGIRPEHPFVVVHPGASAASRRYPPAAFANVVKQLTGEHHLQVVITGQAHERDLANEVLNQSSLTRTSLAGELDLQQLAAVLEAAAMLLSNNTGPVHVAAAVGTPVVDLYALTNPQHTPWQVPSRVLSHDVPCKYCYKSVCPQEHGHCLSLIPPQSVTQAVLDLLAETMPRRKARSAAIG